MKKNLKLNVKVSVKEIFEAAQNVALGTIFISKEDVVAEIEGYQVIHCNDIIWGANARIACSGKIGFVFDCVYVDDYFFALPEFVREFIMQHEIGHLKLKHNDKIESIYLNNFKRMFVLDNKELEADAYAVEVLGKEKVEQALEYLWDSVTFSSKSNKEFKKRLNKVRAI